VWVELDDGSDVLIEVADDEQIIDTGFIEVESDGPQGPRGMPGPPNVLTVGSVTTAPPGSLADAAVSGVSPAQRLDLVIPRGDKGETGNTGATGPANSLSVGAVTTGAPGSAAAASITGAAPAQTLGLTIPRGDVGATGAKGDKGDTGNTGATGPANTLTVGDVVTGAPGSAAAAAITGAAPAQELDLTIPRGDTGLKGDKGDPGDLTPAAAGVASGNMTLGSLPLTSVRTLTGNVTGITLPAPAANVSGTITLVLKQAAAGGPYTVTWPALEWAGDALPPAMPTVANAELIVHLFWTGLAWRAMVAGVFYP
jgi:hypothetical protein